MARAFRIRNWTKFQHYKDRNPPWIKLHVEILSSEDWVTLDDDGKLLAIACMVVAAKHDGEVPNNPDYIKRVAYLEQYPNFGPLILCGFLEEPLADDSKLIATARPEKETQVRSQKTETEKIVVAREARSKPKFSIPESFPDDEAIRRAQGFWTEKGRPDLAHSVRDEVDQFRDHHLKSGSRFSDWQAAWRTWVRNALRFNKPTKVSAHDKGTEGGALYLAKVERGHGPGHRDGAGETSPSPRLLPPRHGREEMGGPIRDIPRGPEGSERGAAPSGMQSMAQQSREREIPDARTIEGSVRPVQDILGAASRNLSSLRR